MNENNADIKARRRGTLFPRSDLASQSSAPKRLLLGTEPLEFLQRPQKLRRMIPEIKAKDKSWLSKLQHVSHKNVVTLHEAMYHDDIINIFYEVMDVSLAQIFRTPIGPLSQFEVAAFCKEILEGLDYIHSHLELVHGDLSSESVLLSTKPPAVKIGMLPPFIGNGRADEAVANIAASMLRETNPGTAQSDLQSMGQIIVECLEPETASRHGNTLTHDNWGTDLREFQSLTKKKTAKELLRRSSGPSCLRRYIRAARESAPKDIEIPPEWVKY
ncbi:predicted protein [Histoplasma mississippiense (nom. inval.)]|uniref:predicted protein n=1 Tax=Ajellomyces capsulatus (strain NAm1 / WU24) TaxID=2059318 RepID=UPI000157B92E|nr:predicted protein [Histoplasma mississippiense (nom. inval.)]EDN03771.1 predicted protein [Histoplasma mississippiense (nom. inval.)]